MPISQKPRKTRIDIARSTNEPTEAYITREQQKLSGCLKILKLISRTTYVMAGNRLALHCLAYNRC